MNRQAASSLLLLCFALTLVGCGGGGTDATSSGASSHAATPAPGPSGEKSIEGFGRESTGSERQAVLGAFHTYLAAVASRDYHSACSHLARPVQHSLSQLAGAAGHVPCPSLLSHLLASTAAPIARQQASGRITKVRTRGDSGFVVFHAPGAKLYQMPMTLEGGEWKVGLVAASILVPSAATLGQGQVKEKDP